MGYTPLASIKTLSFFLQDLTGLPSTSLAWGGGWHQDKEAHGLSSSLVNSNNLLCLLTPISSTY